MVVIEHSDGTVAPVAQDTTDALTTGTGNRPTTRRAAVMIVVDDPVPTVVLWAVAYGTAVALAGKQFSVSLFTQAVVVLESVLTGGCGSST